MPCYWPIKAYVGPVKEKGKVNVVFKRSQSYRAEALYLPCGQCIGCRLEYSRQWAIRCMHEAQMYEKNCFITLTYEDSKLPYNGSLDVKEWQGFMKRLRKKYGAGIRFYHCGEYGEKLGRCHYHGLLFNHDFEDKKLWSEKDGNRLYTSEDLSRLWTKGFSTVGDVTFKSASYVARYVMKKVNGKEKENHYKGLKPEYTTMSRRPGIGFKWFEKYKSDIYPCDNVVVNGVKTRPPKYYDYLLDNSDSELFDRLKIERKNEAKKYEMDNDSFRLPVKEFCTSEKVKMLVRNLEVENG